jgi:hypothetical protein
MSTARRVILVLAATIVAAAVVPIALAFNDATQSTDAPLVVDRPERRSDTVLSDEVLDDFDRRWQESAEAGQELDEQRLRQERDDARRLIGVVLLVAVLSLSVLAVAWAVSAPREGRHPSPSL